MSTSVTSAIIQMITTWWAKVTPSSASIIGVNYHSSPFGNLILSISLVLWPIVGARVYPSTKMYTSQFSRKLSIRSSNADSSSDMIINMYIGYRIINGAYME